MLEKVPQGGQMGMLYYWPTPQPPAGDSWSDEAHSLSVYQSPWHQTPPRGCLKLLHSYEPQDGNEGDKHEVVHFPAVQARHNCPHEGHCTAIQRRRNGKVIHQTQIQRVDGECALENRHGGTQLRAPCVNLRFFFGRTPTP